MIDRSTEDRESKPVLGKEKIVYIIENYLKNQKLYLKNYVKKVPVKVQVQDDKNLKVFLPFDYELEGSIVLYSVLGKYVEIELKFLETLGIGRHLFEPTQALIATSGRRQDREIVDDLSINGTEFRVLPSEGKLIKSLHAGISDTGVSIEHIFQDYEKRLLEFYPRAEIKSFTFDSGDKLISLVNQTKRMFLIEDTQNEETYFHDNEEVINYGVRIDDIGEKKKEFLDNNIRSIMIYPVILHRYHHRDIPFAYIKIWSEDELLELDALTHHLNFTAIEMINNIRKALLITFDIEQKVLNISTSGVKLAVDDPELKEYIYANEEFMMDLSFKIGKQDLSPITFQCRVAYTDSIKDEDMGAGISFIGSEKKGFKKLEQYLDLWNERAKPKEK